MRIVDALSLKAICIDIKAVNKEQVLEELVDLLILGGGLKKNDKMEVLNKIKDRESLGSTGIGKGIGIPHTKNGCVKKMCAAVGVSKKGIDFKSLDGEPTFIFFILIAPNEEPGQHLKTLAKVSRLLDDRFVRERLRTAKTAQDVSNVLEEEERKIV
ncbi:PTS transporter subunit IIA-like nitrogen-regulatory protein PtsN [Candidatus Omnitrophus magneticus]|uniref:PTS transporter subunit IIA-like nitrogen-regulatory protein PtsN n=1 Tax=Candidatus Omnitrophus magneticus TaxID=1609969 RepID=A0A0F0CS05_9BACT|nr:PTS transporter subunit IIA-like nitrogen-regulatory protein PtsN [Candidatus Omnitrophus magneticus]